MINLNQEVVLSVRHWTNTLFSFTCTRDPSFLDHPDLPPDNSRVEQAAATTVEQFEALLPWNVKETFKQSAAQPSITPPTTHQTVRPKATTRLS